MLRPGSRFYAEEILEPFIRRTRWLLEHPPADRFDAAEFRAALEQSGLSVTGYRRLGGLVAWYVAQKPAAA